MTAQGLAVILISHKLSEVMQSDRVTVLRRGKRVATVTTAETTKEALTAMMVGRPVASQIRGEETAPGEVVLSVRDLWLRHARGHQALRGVSFDLRRGEILGLAGVAGNGQDELFETLIGVQRPDRGEIHLAGTSIAGSSPRRIMAQGVGYIPSDRFRDGLVPEFSIAENLVLGEQRSEGFHRGPFLDYDRINGLAMDCMGAFGIVAPSPQTPARRLSGSNAQKVILARELRQATKCLLCNQPTRGLDVGVIEHVQQQLLQKRRDGVAILLASEELEDVLSLSDRIAVMFRGQIMGILDADAADMATIGLMMAGQHAAD